MKKNLAYFLLTILVIALTACSGGAMETISMVAASEMETSVREETVTESVSLPDPEPTSTPVSVEYDSDDLEPSEGGSDMSTIELEGESITFEGSGATVNGTVVTISSAGTYGISGVMNDGKIIVDTEDKETVVLVLNGVDITSATSAPIYVVNAEKTVITLADGTDNTVTDGAQYVLDPESEGPNAAIFSKDDLTINGGGSLTVNANYNNGITSKDDLKITGGTITVIAVNDGIKGRDSIAVLDGSITIVAGGDGMQANNVEDPEEGYVSIEGGKVLITAGLDGIQAETQLAVSGGELAITAGGGSNSNTTADSAKGLKAGVGIGITDGVIDIDSADDGIHANGNLTLDGGYITVASGDDGLRSDIALTINDGDIHVIQSYEGIESSLITINDGTVYLFSSDDGINAVSEAGTGKGVDSSQLHLNGGYVYLDAGGDGLDSNGTGRMTGGVVIVQGTTFHGNGALDVNGVLEITGGYLIAVGSAGMPQAPNTASTQNSIAMVLDSVQLAGTVLHIESQDGQELLTFEPAKEYQLVVFSSPDLETNETYNVYVGGGSTGTVTDGLVENGSYSAGSQVASLELSSSVTTLGSFEGAFGGGGSRGQRP